MRLKPTRVDARTHTHAQLTATASGWAELDDDEKFVKQDPAWSPPPFPVNHLSNYLCTIPALPTQIHTHTYPHPHSHRVHGDDLYDLLKTKHYVSLSFSLSLPHSDGERVGRAG